MPPELQSDDTLRCESCGASAPVNQWLAKLAAVFRTGQSGAGPVHDFVLLCPNCEAPASLEAVQLTP